MYVFSKTMSVLAIGMVMVWAAPSFAEVKADIANGEKIFKLGKPLLPHADPGAAAKEPVPAQVAEAQAGIEVPACVTCHGDDGMGNDSMGTPRLIGVGYAYIVKQLDDFAAKRRMDTTMFVMNDNAKGLSEQERRDVAAYVTWKFEHDNTKPIPSSKQEVVGLGNQWGRSNRGQTIVLEGIPAKGVSACSACHGYAGRGAAPVYPAIANQRFVYLTNQLKKWRAGAQGDKENGRTNDPLGQMRAIANNLTDEDIADVATYLTGAARTTIGNSRVPENMPVFSELQLSGIEAVGKAAQPSK